MMRKLVLTVLLVIVTTGMISAQAAKPLPAEKILSGAVKEAKETDKTVLVFFHASWCSWCKRLEKAIESAELKGIFEGNYVITRLDVKERGDKIAELENPGGNELMVKFGGEKAGLPFLVFVDADGKKIADSNIMPENQNVGYPGVKEEIEAVAKVLKSTSKHLSDAQLATIVEYFTKNAPKPKN